MARSIATIQAAIWGKVEADTTLSGMLTSSSTTAIWWAWTWVVATVQAVQEGLFEAFQELVVSTIATQKPHTLGWYITKAKAYQHGASLPTDSDVYSPVAPAGDPSLVVTFADAVELTNLVRIKVATGTVGALAPLGTTQLAGLTAYMKLVKDAGVRLNITTGNADNLQVGGIIYYDPLVLDSTGARLDGTSATPVPDAVNAFLNSLPFNGVFDFVAFLMALKAVDGVKTPDITTCQANYGATPYVNIITANPQEYTPDAGYLALDAVYFAANITFQAL
jgi:hypothetical protein